MEYDTHMTRNDILRPVYPYPYHGECPDDSTYREHAARLVGKRRWHEVLPDTVDREIIAMYLGILSMRRVQAKPEVVVTYGRVFTPSTIIANLVNRYGITHQNANNKLANAFSRFTESMPESEI